MSAADLALAAEEAKYSRRRRSGPQLRKPHRKLEASLFVGMLFLFYFAMQLMTRGL